MGASYRVFGLSMVVTIAATTFYDSSLSSIKLFLSLFVPGVVLNAIYSTLIYPLLLSPLRHLPQPADSHFLFGNFFKLMALPSGEPHREWLRIPNDGLVMYRSLWNHESVLATTPKVLQQALATDVEIWVKPAQMRRSVFSLALGRRGLLFTEGAEHRAQRRIVAPAFTRAQIRRLARGPPDRQHSLAPPADRPGYDPDQKDRKGQADAQPGR